MPRSAPLRSPRAAAPRGSGGGWRRELGKDRVQVQARLLRLLDARERRALVAAAARYGEFLGLRAELVQAR